MKFPTSEIITALYQRRRTWRSVSEIMARIGIECTPAYWRMVATGERKLSRRAENTLRFALGYHPVGQARLWQWSEGTMRRYLRARGEI